VSGRAIEFAGVRYVAQEKDAHEELIDSLVMAVKAAEEAGDMALARELLWKQYEIAKARLDRVESFKEFRKAAIAGDEG
jgi:hypothetical protein